MKPFLWNLLLALVWVGLSGDFSPRGAVVGLVLGYAVIALAGPAVGTRGYGARVLRTVGFLLFYLGELLLSNLRVALDVLRPRSRSSPAFVAIPVEGLSDPQITLLANLITMTPGTLSIDVTDDRSKLFIHAMFVRDADGLRRTIEHDLVRRVRAVVP